MWLDGKQTQQAGMAFDVHSSLIFIEMTDGTRDAFRSIARRLRREVRAYDSVLQRETGCALLLPATPFSGAQAVAGRIAPLLSGFPYQLHVYHGATALLVLERLRKSGASPVSMEESDETLPSDAPPQEPLRQFAEQERASRPLPYLAFLSDYPPSHLLHLFPYDLACRYQCVPVGSERKMLTLATCHGLNREIVAHLRTATRREIFQVRCEMTIIDEVLRYWQRMQDLSSHNCAKTRADEQCRPSR